MNVKLFKKQKNSFSQEGNYQSGITIAQYNETHNSLQDIAKHNFAASAMISSFDLKLNYYSDIIGKAVNKMQEIAHSTATMSQQTTAGMTDISMAIGKSAETLQDISEKSSIIYENTNKNTEMVQEIGTKNQVSLSVAYTMKNEFNELIKSLNLIKETMSGIENIARQTNLLALNASIEAAKAGETGKGFSVIAEEIRKLSTDTKKLLDSTNSLINNVEKASISSSESVDKTVNLIQDINQNLEVVDTHLVDNTNAVSELNASLSEIAAFNQQLNATIQEITAVSQVLSGQTETTLTTASNLSTVMNALTEMSSDISKLENTLDYASKESGALVSKELWKLSNHDFENNIEKAINTHKNWVRTLKEMIENKEITPLQTDEHKCAFGHFYYSVHPQNEKIVGLWNDVEFIHSDLHKSAEIVIQHIRNNEYSQAREIYEKVDKKSQEIIATFNKILDICHILTAQGQSVFTMKDFF